ncbi:MAG: YheT family hydrolase [Solimonas sp.]
MLLVCLAVVILLALWAAHYRRHAVRAPLLRHHRSDFNQRIVERLKQLHEPYRPTPWLYNPHLQLLWLVLKDALAPRLAYERSDPLRMADGGTTSLEWLGLDRDPRAPTLVVLHTISGDAQSMRDLVAELHRRSGWRVVVCTRRGHGGLRLTTPSINPMGSTHDLRQQLLHIREAFPESPLYAVGVSAGSALLVRYLGEEGSASLIRAGVAYCPGYDIAVAFRRAHPFYSRKVAETLKQKFVAPNAALFGHLPTYARCLAAGDLAEFQDHVYEMAGCASLEDYLALANPMAVFEGIAKPILVINADDDPLCVVQNTLDHAETVARIENALLVRTARGSHCAHFEGWTARSWSNGLIADYLLAVHRETALEPAASGSS